MTSLFDDFKLFTIESVLEMTKGKEQKDLLFNWNVNFISKLNPKYAEKLRKSRTPIENTLNVYVTDSGNFNVSFQGQRVENIFFDIDQSPLLKVLSFEELDSWFNNTENTGTLILDKALSLLSVELLEKLSNLPSCIAIITAKGEEIQMEKEEL